MKKNLKVVFSVALTVLMMCTFVFTTNAATIEELVDLQLTTDALAEKYLMRSEYINDDGSEVIQIDNVNRFEDKLRASNKNSSDKELAKTLYRYLGEREDVIDNLPDEMLLEVFDFNAATIVTNYIQYSENGEQTFLDSETMLQKLAVETSLTSDGKEFVENSIYSQSESVVSPRGSVVTTSNDGYMKLTTSAYETTGNVENRTFFIISARSQWLKEPNWKVQDVLAITSSATYDNTYNNYGYFEEWCTQSLISNGDVVEEYYIKNSIYKNEGTDTPDDIWFEYTEGIGGIALRFNMVNIESLYPSDVCNYEYTMRSFVRFRASLYNVDGAVQAAYCHRLFSITDIKVDLATGDIDFSVVGGKEEYFGEPLAIYY